MKSTTAFLALAVAACSIPSTSRAPAAGEALGGLPSPPVGAPTATPRPATSLVWWTVPPLAPSVDGSGETRLDKAVAAFERQHPEVALRAAIKPGRGPGGIAGLLAATARVAPAMLPDVTVLPLDALTDPDIRPHLRLLGGAVAEERLDDAFPFAATGSRGGDGDDPIALPLAVGTVHAIARDREPPASWAGMSAAAPFVVAAPRPDCGDLTPLLAWYAAAGGAVDALPEVTPAALERALGFVADGSAEQVFQIADSGADRSQTTWNAFLESGAASGAVEAGTFAQHQQSFPALAWGPLPGPERSAPTVGCGWALAVTATDPERIGMATTFLEWLTAPEWRAWVVEAGQLPPYRDQWSATVGGAVASPPEPAYLAFLEAQLADATPIFGVEAWGEDWAAGYAAALAGEQPDVRTSTP